MKSMSGKELKQAWKTFWEKRQHMFLPEAPLIGGKESTAMFNIAGMQQLIPYLSGQAHPLGKRLFNIQKCIRTVDIDEVGDKSHLTFFEMMGNRSLGDYFKKEAVQWSWEFLVDVLGFEEEKLAATVFEGDKDVAKDEETIGYWKAVGLDEARICAMTADDNRRSPGPVGPCGPCTEIYYRVGDTKLPPKGSTPKTDEKNWLEVWNNVFMEYYRSEETEEVGRSEEKKTEEKKINGMSEENWMGRRSDEKQQIDKKTEKIIGICIKLHKKYGNSLTEKQYQSLVTDFLSQEGFSVDKEKRVEIIENNKSYGSRYIDLVIDENIFIELKNNANPIEIKKGFKQLRSYLALNGGFVGLLINFGTDKLGVNRLNNFPEKTLQTSNSPKYKLTRLPQINVDTGMGFERMCTVLQQKESVYETDVFASLLALIVKYVGLPYEGNEKRYRVIADHLRTSFFMIKDGITPSNEGRGYVLRRLIRRMYYNMMLLKEVDTKTLPWFLQTIVKEIVSLFDLTGNFDAIISLLEKEVVQFQKTISNGQKLLQDIIKSAKKKVISGADAFKLYDTFGFPVELTKEIALEHGFAVDEAGCEKEMQAQQQRSRKGSKDMFKQDVDRSKYIADVPPTKFVGYETMKTDETKLLKDFEVSGQRILIFDQTPMYAESGGQVGDTGTVILDSGEQLHIKEVKKYEGVFLHFVE